MDDIKSYEALANAIVVQAVLDYKGVYGILLKHPEDRMAQAEAKRIKRFFHSRWFRMLTSLDAEYLIRMVEDEVESGVKRTLKSKGVLTKYGNH